MPDNIVSGIEDPYGTMEVKILLNPPDDEYYYKHHERG
jgi:hypothetical protein